MDTTYYFLNIPEDIKEMCEDYYFCTEQYPHGMCWSCQKEDFVFINLKVFKTEEQIPELIKCIIHEELHKIIHHIIHDMRDPEWPMEKLELN